MISEFRRNTYPQACLLNSWLNRQAKKETAGCTALNIEDNLASHFLKQNLRGWGVGVPDRRRELERRCFNPAVAIGLDVASASEQVRLKATQMMLSALLRSTMNCQF